MREQVSAPFTGPWYALLLPALTLLLGYLITALAIMLGAPFWFDMLNKIMMIRSSLKPEEKPKTGGK